MGVTNLEVYNTVYNIDQHNNSFKINLSDVLQNEKNEKYEYCDDEENLDYTFSITPNKTIKVFYKKKQIDIKDYVEVYGEDCFNIHKEKFKKIVRKGEII